MCGIPCLLQVTKAALKELAEAEAKVAETQRKWIEAFRRLAVER